MRRQCKVKCDRYLEGYRRNGDGQSRSGSSPEAAIYKYMGMNWVQKWVGAKKCKLARRILIKNSTRHEKTMRS